MAQVLKEEVRSRIAAAALREFAERGYPGATMAAIAARAGLGAASTYRYHASKLELFEALVTPEVARRFEELLDRRVRGLARSAFAEAARPGEDFGEEMLRFWLAHRLEVVILLDRAEGTAHAGFGRRFVQRLTRATLANMREAGMTRRASAVERFVLERIFDNTRRLLAAVLEAHADEGALREAVAAFWSYQVPGVRGLAAWMRGRGPG